MADLLLDANAQAAAARAARHDSLDDAQLARIRSWFRGAVAKGLADNTGKTSQIAKDGLTLGRRFRASEDMIHRFAVDLAAGFTSNQAERDVRPVKVQQRTSGGVILISRPVTAAPAGACPRADRRRSQRRDRLPPHTSAAVQSQRRSHGPPWIWTRRLDGLPCRSLVSRR